MKKIAFLLRYFPIYGGGETVTRTLANEFAKRNYSVSIIYFKDREWEKNPYIDNRIKLFRIDNIEIDGFNYDQSQKIEVRNTLLNYVNENQIDIIINQWWPVSYLSNIQRECNAKLISCHHMNICQRRIHKFNSMKEIIKSLFYFYFDKREMEKKANIIMPDVINSDKYVFLSKYFVKDFLDLTGYNDSSGKLTYVNNPLTFESYLPKEEIVKKENIVLFVGRIENEHKRLDLILKSWRLVELNNHDWKLVIVGTGSDMERNKLIAKELKLSNYSFEGYKNPLEFYKKASIFVMASHHEGWGMTLVESQQNGVVPVVMDTFSSVHEIIENGVNGILIKDLDVIGMAKSIIYLINNNKEREKMAINGINTCKRFEIKNIADRWESIFNELL